MSTRLVPRLMPALVPAPLWGRSVYQILRATRRGGAWKRLRADVVDRAGGDCHVCGTHQDRFMVCHEGVGLRRRRWRGHTRRLRPQLLGVRRRHPPRLRRAHRTQGDRSGPAREGQRHDRRGGPGLLDVAGKEFVQRSLRPWTVTVSAELCQRYPVPVGVFDHGNDEKAQR